MISLPFKFRLIKEYPDHIVIMDTAKITYSLYQLDKIDMLAYKNLRKSEYIKEHIYGYKDNNKYYLIFKNTIKKSDFKSNQLESLRVSKLIYDEYKFKHILKKEQFRSLSNMYKLLDNKFNYIEMRIRELEMAPIKNDFIWIFLSKYHAILDAKVILYDLQTDILKFIEKEISVDYGLVFRFKSLIEVENGLIEPNLNYYYAPISMLYARYYLAYDHVEFIDDFYIEIDRISEFDKKYFCFMVLYVYVLNLNLDILGSSQSMDLYINICKKIDLFYKKFNKIIKWESMTLLFFEKTSYIILIANKKGYSCKYNNECR